MRFCFSIFAVILIITLYNGCSANKKALSSQSRPKKQIKRELQESLQFSAVLTKNGSIQLNWDLKDLYPSGIEKITVFRSVEDLEKTPLNLKAFSITPLTILPAEKKGSLTDLKLASGVTYYYLIEVITKEGNPGYGKVVSIKTPAKTLSNLQAPWIHIDKINYLLEVIDGETIVKTYPISLGKDPFHRKLHQDNATTPEGIYRITNLQPRATYYKAYDINYPNETDENRYKLSILENQISRNEGVIPGIGGEIQIHGGYDEVGQNWTAGCITLRNTDMDELFNHSKIGKDTKVIITGNELTYEDLGEIGKERSIDEIKTIQLKLKKEGFNPIGIDGKMGDNTRRALCRFQSKCNLPLTMELDERTIKKLEEINLKEQ